MKILCGVLVFVMVSAVLQLLFDGVTYVIHYLLFDESLYDCMKNDPLKRRMKKCFIVLSVASVLFAVLLAAIVLLKEDALRG